MFYATLCTCGMLYVYIRIEMVGWIQLDEMLGLVGWMDGKAFEFNSIQFSFQNGI